MIDPLHWHDISNEIKRIYHYPDGSEYVIIAPLQLNIQPSSLGGHAHRVKSDGRGHYIKPGWNAISWEAPDGGFRF